MPRWDFECPECGHCEEHSFKSFEDIVPPICPFCDFWYDNPKLMTRLVAAPGTFVLKGSGFHKNDYPKGR